MNTQTPQQNIIVLVTSDDGCINLAELNLNVIPLADISVTPQHESCLGTNDGSMQISAADAQLFSIDGLNWQTDNNFNDLSSGTYYAYVENTSACVDSIEFIINEGLLLSISDLQIACNDNNTPIDETDDFYSINFIVQPNIETNTTLTINAGTDDIGTYEYEETITLVFPAQSQSLTLNIIDEMTGCAIQQDLGTLQPCSSDCQINISQFDMVCSDNGTPTISSDDFYTFTFNASAINGASNNNFDLLINNNYLNSFPYGLTAEFTLPADDSTPIISFIDSEDIACQAIQTAPPLTPCSDDCQITVVVDDVTCDNHGTTNDPTDDTFSFNLTVSGINNTTMWSTDIAGISGDYDMSQSFDSFLISDGDIILNIFDSNINSCSMVVTIEAPTDCSSCNPDVNAGDSATLTCAITSVNLQGTSSLSGDFNWSGPNGFQENGLNISTSEAGWYYLAGDFGQNCSAIDSILVLEDLELPLAEVNPVFDDLDCLQEEINLNGNNSSVGSEFEYEWTGPGIVEGFTGLEPTINLPGEYELIVTNTINGCTETATVSIEANPEIPTDAAVTIDPPICFGELGYAEIISIEGGTGPYVFSLDNGITFSSDTILGQLEPGVYNLLIQDSRGCEYVENFSIPSAPELTLEIEGDIIVAAGENIQLNAFVNIPESQISEIIWSPAQWLSCIDCLNPIATPSDNITYNLLVIDENGCEISSEISLLLDNELNIYFPNVFSPDDDNINSKFMAFAAENSVSQINYLRIYDRWGELIFLETNFQPNDETFGWDGTFRDQELNPGVFVYLAEVMFVSGETLVFRGDLTLIR